MRTTTRLITPATRRAAKTVLDVEAEARRPRIVEFLPPDPPKVIRHYARTIDIPSTLGACADALYTLREQRLLVEKQAEAIKARETAIRDHLIDTLPKNDSTGTSGKVARAQIKTKRVPSVEDWPALYKYVKRTGAFELLQRRLSTEAITERWEAGKKVPGVGAFNTVTVSVTKL